jgi:hypothetical protein
VSVGGSHAATDERHLVAVRVAAWFADRLRPCTAFGSIPLAGDVLLSEDGKFRCRCRRREVAERLVGRRVSRGVPGPIEGEHDVGYGAGRWPGRM